MDKLPDITIANCLLIQEREVDTYLDAVSMFNKFNGSRIKLTFLKKNHETGDAVYTVTGISMLQDVLEIGRRVQVLKITQNKKQ